MLFGCIHQRAGDARTSRVFRHKEVIQNPNAFCRDRGKEGIELHKTETFAGIGDSEKNH
jgi:hypothetical protein